MIGTGVLVLVRVGVRVAVRVGVRVAVRVGVNVGSGVSDGKNSVSQGSCRGTPNSSTVTGQIVSQGNIGPPSFGIGQIEGLSGDALAVGVPYPLRDEADADLVLSVIPTTNTHITIKTTP